MSNSDKPDAPPLQDFLEDSLVGETRRSLSGLFKTVIEAMAEDTQDLLADNGASDTATGSAIPAFTNTMIKLLAKSVETALQTGRPANSPGPEPGAADSAKPKK